MAKRRPPRSKIHRQIASKPSKPGIDFQRWIPTLAQLAALWFVFAAMEVALNALIPGSALRNEGLSRGARLGLVSYDLALLVVFVLVIGGPLTLLVRLGESGVRPGIRWVIRGLLMVWAWVAVLLYGASWATFWNAGVFIDREAFIFMVPHPVQVFHWVYPPLAIGILAATLLVGVGVSEGLPRWVARRRPAWQRHLALAVGGAVGVCLVGALLSELMYGWGGIEAAPSETPYAVNRDDRSGPFAHALAGLRRSVWSPPEQQVVKGNIKVSRRPIISMEQYLAGVARDRVKPWNVIILLIESLRSDQLRVYGGSRDVMPTLDALARESRVFTNAYIQASHSNYEDLVPLSSHYPLRSIEVYEYPKNPTYPRMLIYDVLKPLGYQTAIFSSQNENWGGMINYLQTGNLDRVFHAETFGGPTYTPWADTGFAEWVKETKGAGSVDDRYTVGEAMQWIDGLGGKPFFMYMNLQSSHVPYIVPPDFPHRFSPKKLDFTIMWGKFPRDKVEVVKAVYADSLAYIDSQLERLFQHLRLRGLWDNTVIVVGGDNGEAFYEHGFASHASALFNEVMKVPLIIRAPGLVPGLDNRPAMHLDDAPSVFHLLGLPPHPSFQGISLFEPRPNPNRSLYMIAQTPLAYQFAIVRSGFKLIWDQRLRGYFLYDLGQDPGEKDNIARSRPDLVEELTGRLRAWREEQIVYYADRDRHTREYPPFFAD